MTIKVGFFPGILSQSTNRNLAGGVSPSKKTHLLIYPCLNKVNSHMLVAMKVSFFPGGLSPSKNNIPAGSLPRWRTTLGSFSLATYRHIAGGLPRFPHFFNNHPLALGNRKHVRHYCSARNDSSVVVDYLEHLHLFGKEDRKSPHDGLIYTLFDFKEDYPQIGNVEFVYTIIIYLLVHNVIPYVKGYSKFTISFTMIPVRQPNERFTYTIGTAIGLTGDDGSLLPEHEICSQILGLLFEQAKIYEADQLTRISMKTFTDSSIKELESKLSFEWIKGKVLSFFECCELADRRMPSSTRPIRHRNRRYDSFISSKKDKKTSVSRFLVADLETVSVEGPSDDGDSDVFFPGDTGAKKETSLIRWHMAYAAGVMVVDRDSDVRSSDIYTYLSEDYSPQLYPRFQDRSVRMLSEFVRWLINLSKPKGNKPNKPIVYFHNFSGFDDILLIKHLVMHHPELSPKPILRNNKLYELNVYSGRKLVLKCRDSLTLFPDSLAKLGQSLCPELGGKGDFDHSNLEGHTIEKRSDS